MVVYIKQYIFLAKLGYIFFNPIARQKCYWMTLQNLKLCSIMFCFFVFLHLCMTTMVWLRSWLWQINMAKVRQLKHKEPVAHYIVRLHETDEELVEFGTHDGQSKASLQLQVQVNLKRMYTDISPLTKDQNVNHFVSKLLKMFL